MWLELITHSEEHNYFDSINLEGENAISQRSKEIHYDLRLFVDLLFSAAFFEHMTFCMYF